MSEITGPHAYWATSTRTFDALRRRYSPEEFKSMKIRFCKFPFRKRSLKDTYKISALSLRMFLLKERRPQPKVKPGHFVILISLPNQYTTIPIRRNRRYSYSPTALGRETSQHDCEAEAGNVLAKTQTNIG